MTLIPHTIEELEIARKQSRRERAAQEKRDAAVRAEMRQRMLSFCQMNAARLAGCQICDKKLWRAIFIHTYGEPPKDPRGLPERIRSWFGHPFGKAALKPAPPPWGATDPRWDELLHQRKAVDALRWALAQQQRSPVALSLRLHQTATDR